MSSPVIYTDLDGTLMDHYSYDSDLAMPTLNSLLKRGIPVIPCTSKTREELRPICSTLGLGGPFIVENGSAVWVPSDWGLNSPKSAVHVDGYWYHVLGLPRAMVRRRLAFLDAEWGNRYQSLSDLTIKQVASITGLDKTAAALAKDRLFCETLVWLGTSADREAFAQQVQSLEMRCVAGGRFVHVLASGGKAEAMHWLHEKIKSELLMDAVSVAAGDACNDIEMMEAADFALVVRSPVHDPPRPKRSEGLVISDAVGPAGWAEGIEALIERIEEENGIGRLLSERDDHNAPQFG